MARRSTRIIEWNDLVRWTGVTNLDHPGAIVHGSASISAQFVAKRAIGQRSGAWWDSRFASRHLDHAFSRHRP